MTKKDMNASVEEIDRDEVQEEATEHAEAVSEQPTEAASDNTNQLTQDLQQTKDQLLRQAAEFQNYRRRTEKERAILLQRGRSEVIEPMLNVLDDFRRSLEASEQVGQQEEASGPAYEALRQGVELVYKNFSDVLEKLGVTEIEAVGKPFDENEHEAVMQMPAPEGTSSGTILHEVQRGYRMGDRVLRHSKVVVAV